MQKTDIHSLTLKELESISKDIGFEAYRGRQVFGWLWKRRSLSFEEMTDLPLSMRKRLLREFSICNNRVIERAASSDGTIKFATLLSDGNIIESVIIPEEGRYTLCLSTQVGCKMGCKFCYTAKMGFIRDLMPSEIAFQVINAINIIGSRNALRNIVLMGMGEPLDNFSNVKKAISIMTDPYGLDFSKRRITLSTVGHREGLYEMGRCLNDIGLAISLHATTDEKRSLIMPANRRFGINDIIASLKKFPLPKRRRITIEYLMIRGFNHSKKDAVGLSRLLSGLKVKINLIPLNKDRDSQFMPPCPEEIDTFKELLRQKGYTVTVRKSKGQDIEAACGQLYKRVKA